MRVLLPLAVLLPVLGAALTLALGSHPVAQRWVSVAALSGVTATAAALLFGAATDGPQSVVLGAWPAGVGISLVADRLSALMLLTSSVVTLSVMLFSVGQGSTGDTERTPVSIYHPTFLTLSAGVSIAFLAGDLFNLYVGFEVLLVSSYVLLTLGGTAARVRAGMTYVVVSIVSSLLFLTGLGLVYAATGTVSMADLPGRLSGLPLAVAVGLQLVLLLAFGLKAAAFPLSGWLPDSYPTAAAPVAAVFAGLLTKVGVYAIFRTQTVLFGEVSSPAVTTGLVVVAIMTMLVGILGAIAQNDLKRLMSFTLVSHIGYMLFGVALGTVEALGAAVFYAVHHILVQTALFLVVGLVERAAGTTSLRRLGGLGGAAPGIALLFLLPALNLAGIPPFSGFIGKIALLRAGAAEGGFSAWALVVAGVVTSLLTLYAISRAWAATFWSGRATRLDPEVSPETAAARAHRVPPAMVAAAAGVVVVVSALTFVAGPLLDLANGAAEDTLDVRGYSQVVGGLDTPPADGSGGTDSGEKAP
ncbi:Na+/H+ antiporter subunit D [Quadrisphaera sp. INWT6]|uniref:Na+/H+ antiporter subunit D n=1 Tax=Quadrisphaera sp. INWT6 TaxID=2596917 RepID=UPI0018920B05|nr:Na+/H+ antiporter subunit D [Quadrisphaera sp. INWT6]MBF5083237.1 Na+/H+ antiporter subunit D [Quadrisphaera sp. INWT6]